MQLHALQDPTCLHVEYSLDQESALRLRDRRWSSALKASSDNDRLKLGVINGEWGELIEEDIVETDLLSVPECKPAEN